MKRALVCAMALSIALIAGSSRIAQANCQQGGTGSLAKAKIALHAIDEPSKKACTTNAPRSFGCSDAGGSTLITDFAVGLEKAVYIVILDIDTSQGVNGAVFGIEYTPYTYANGQYYGTYVSGWTSCSTLEFPGNGWPASGGGNVQTWTSCEGQTADAADPEGEGVAVCGYLTTTAYSDDLMSLTPRFFALNDFQVTSCGGASSDPCWPQNAGQLGTGAIPGYNPCIDVTAVEPTSWGAIKQDFKSEE